MGIGSTRRIKLIPYSVSQDGNGENIETQGTKINTWAEVSNPSGFRAYMNGQNSLGVTKHFLIRYNFDITPGVNWRIQYDNRIWAASEISKVDEKQFYYQVTATSKNEF